MFITFEGPEGAGKTTVLRMIAERMTNEGVPFMVTREPGGIKIAERIREMILDPAHTAMDNRTEALLFAAARAQHYYEKVEPALKEGKVVLCDRFIDSSLVYQGLARGLGVEEVKMINEFVIGKRMPDKTFLLDVESSVGLARINANRQDEINRIDKESLVFHNEVREGYLNLAKLDQVRYEVVDASQELEMVVETVWGMLKNLVRE